MQRLKHGKETENGKYLSTGCLLICYGMLSMMFIFLQTILAEGKSGGDNIWKLFYTIMKDVDCEIMDEAASWLKQIAFTWLVLKFTSK